VDVDVGAVWARAGFCAGISSEPEDESESASESCCCRGDADVAVSVSGIGLETGMLVDGWLGAVKELRAAT
jgi:hypothetical protein